MLRIPALDWCCSGASSLGMKLAGLLACGVTLVASDGKAPGPHGQRRRGRRRKEDEAIFTRDLQKDERASERSDAYSGSASLTFLFVVILMCPRFCY